MLPKSQADTSARTGTFRQIDLRLVAAVVLLAVAVAGTRLVIVGLAARRTLRIELAEIGHARYDLLNADHWVEKLVPILDARIDSLDLKASSQANLRPTIENALYHLLDDVKDKMAAQKPQAGGLGSLLGQGNSLLANMMIGALRPHVPEYANVVLAEIGRPENREALKKYIRATLADAARTTFGAVDMRWYSSILRSHGCAAASDCRQKLDERIRRMDADIARDYLAVLAASAAAFALLMIGRPRLGRAAVMLLMLVCITLLLGGIMTPMLEVEAKISSLNLTFLGQPISFGEQVLYFQSKSVLEVFRTLVTMGRPEMWIVGVLVLTFSVIFPALKILTLAVCMAKPSLLESSRAVRFMALGSSKWSMADVMALAIFMSFVAFNGLIANMIGRFQGSGAQLVIPMDSSKILPGYYLFVGFCLAGLLLASKLERGFQSARGIDQPALTSDVNAA